jgi:hypothetical protein
MENKQLHVIAVISNIMNHERANLKRIGSKMNNFHMKEVKNPNKYQTFHPSFWRIECSSMILRKL